MVWVGRSRTYFWHYQVSLHFLQVDDTSAIGDIDNLLKEILEAGQEDVLIDNIEVNYYHSIPQCIHSQNKILSYYPFSRIGM